MLGRLPLGTSSVPVLCYHNVGGDGVGRAQFVEQLDWLRSRGVQTLTPTEFESFLSGRPLQAPSVLLTFDDGFRDVVTFIAPELAKRAMHGLVFMIAGRMRPDDVQGVDGEIDGGVAHRAWLTTGETSAWLSAEELHELAGQGTVTFGLHGLHHTMCDVQEGVHANLPTHWAYADLAGTPPPYPKRAPSTRGSCLQETTTDFRQRLKNELGEARQMIEAAAGVPCTHFAWPWGEYTDDGVQAAIAAGCSHLYTLARSAVTQQTDVSAIGRVEVRCSKPLGWFADRVALYSRASTAKLYSGMRL